MARTRNRMTSSDQAKPCKVQHRKPCKDCPFARSALPGWLGGYTPPEYLILAHGEAKIDCHTKKGPQCAGAAVYRANCHKLPIDASILLLPMDREQVFATPIEFMKHHQRDQ